MPVNTKCQVFTPQRNAQQLLDSVGYIENLYGKKVAENSCGDGSILSEIVERYIVDSLKHGFSLRKIKAGLKNDIWGAEIDITHILNCRNKLNEIAAKYGLFDVPWNIFEGDFLKENICNRFDFVIGNPPYITYKELDLEDRTFVRNSFETCVVGKFDYCYAFIEASIKSLKNTGKLAYLIPSNIFKNQFAFNLRQYILSYLTDIYDFSNMKLFTGKLTASAIIVCNMNDQNKDITYHNLSQNHEFTISKDHFQEKWIFEKSDVNSKKEEIIRFGDYFHAASSIATLLNEVFIIDKFIEEDTYIKVKEQRIEKGLLREAVSPRSLNFGKKEYVIFPYYYTENELKRYSEKEFEKKFPCAVKYLRQFEDRLSERNSDDGVSWFEYGRSQALTHLNQPKLLVSTLITGKVKVAKLDEYTIPTSGLYIVPKNGQKHYKLCKAYEILNDSLFLEYVEKIGVISNGNSFRVSSKDINNFVFPANLL